MPTMDATDAAVHSYDRAGVRVLPVFGEFDLANSGTLENLIELALAGDQPVIVDFSATGYIDSTVLTVLVRQKRHAGDRLRIVVPAQSRLRRIFAITGLEARLELKTSLEDAGSEPTE